MIPIPPAIQTLIQSKVMVGENRPNGYIEIDGQPITGFDPLDPTTWTNWIDLVDGDPVRTWGNMTETEDGRAIIAYIEGDTNGSKELKIAYGSNVEDILTQAETFNTAQGGASKDAGQPT